MKKSVFIVSAVALVAASCGSPKVATDVAALDGEWNIVEVEGKKINKGDCENVPFLGFDTKKSNLYGNTGCNTLTGALKVNAKKSSIDFSQTGTTMMMCADMKVERMVLDALGKSNGFVMEGNGKMTLNDKKGNAVVKLQKR